MRMGPITGSIGESWPLFVPFDDDPVSCPPGDSHGTGCQNFLRVGGGAGWELVYPDDAPWARRTMGYRVQVRLVKSPPWV
jgi:hypothetical protein